MPNLSPADAREKYTLYDGKLHSGAEAAASTWPACGRAWRPSAARVPVTDRGDSLMKNGSSGASPL